MSDVVMATEIEGLEWALETRTMALATCVTRLEASVARIDDALDRLAAIVRPV